MGYNRGENALPVLVVLTTEKGIVKGKCTVGIAKNEHMPRVHRKNSELRKANKPTGVIFNAGWKGDRFWYLQEFRRMIVTKYSRPARRSMRQGICRFLNLGEVQNSALSNTGIKRKLKRGLRWLHGSIFLLRCKLERPCSEGVEGLHGSEVKHPPAKPRVRNVADIEARKRPTGVDRYCLMHFYRGRNALPTFL